MNTETTYHHPPAVRTLISYTYDNLLRVKEMAVLAPHIISKITDLQSELKKEWEKKK
jgi:hypothetical protein